MLKIELLDKSHNREKFRSVGIGSKDTQVLENGRPFFDSGTSCFAGLVLWNERREKEGGRLQRPHQVTSYFNKGKEYKQTRIEFQDKQIFAVWV